jgi:co-chaperonin GroES (HSP10)
MIQPIGTRVAISRAEFKQTGTIEIPLVCRADVREGKIVAMGPKVELPIKVGDRVQFSAVDAVLQFNGEEILIVKEDQLLAVIP